MIPSWTNPHSLARCPQPTPSPDRGWGVMGLSAAGPRACSTVPWGPLLTQAAGHYSGPPPLLRRTPGLSSYSVAQQPGLVRQETGVSSQSQGCGAGATCASQAALGLALSSFDCPGARARDRLPWWTK